MVAMASTIVMSPPVMTPPPALAPPAVVMEPPSPPPSPPPAPIVVTPPPVAKPSLVASAPAPSAVQAPAAPDEPIIRIPFDRIADQLPPDVFVLPPERLAESVREPHVIVIPSRLVLPQLGEGAVEIPWTLIEDQFPELALAMPKSEVRHRFPGWVLSLPMDEVVRQLPSHLYRPQAPAVELLDLSQFPAPFTPQAPEPEQTPVPEPIAAAVVTTPVAPPPTIEPAEEPVAEEKIPAVVFAFTEPAAVAPPAPIPAPSPMVPVAAAEPAAVIVPPPVVVAPLVVTPAPMLEGPPAPVVATAPPVLPAVDQEAEALGRTLALGLTQLGAFDWEACRADGQPLVSFVSPALSREPIDALAVEAVPLVARLASWGIEQVTIRTTRVVCVLTPLLGRGCLAATVRRGGPVAMLEMLSARAGRAAGGVPGSASPSIAFPAVATAPATNGNGHRVAEAARALAAFGPLAMSVAAAEGTAPSVYVFGGQDQAVLAGAARAVHETLVAGHDQEALGRLESVVLHRGRERAVLRPLRGPGGQLSVLAAAGEVALEGRAHRAVAEAAALLEAH
jgi:hypothetical protein